MFHSIYPLFANLNSEITLFTTSFDSISLHTTDPNNPKWIMSEFDNNNPVEIFPNVSIFLTTDSEEAD